MTLPRPASVCAALLAALDASEGRRRRRKRDTTPDTIGMSLKRSLLARVIEADPEADAFEGLARRVLPYRIRRRLAGRPARHGADVLAEWRLASVSADFRAWLAAGAPSDDRG